MSDPVFGIGITRQDDEPRSAVKTDMSVIGLVGTAPDADVDKFPVNDPVLFFSDDAAAVTALGLTGSLPGALELINSQLDDFQAAAQVIFVRVEEGADENETITNLVGNSSLKTGIHALRIAGPKLGIVPRLVGVPGFTHQRDTGVTAIAVTAGGTGYTSAPTIAFTGGDGSGAAGTAVLGTGADAGKVMSVTITNPGTGYTSAPTIAFTGGAGSGAAATATVNDLANAVCAALPSLLSALLAHAVVSGPHSTLQAFTDWREALASDRLIPVETWVKVGVDGTVVDSVPAILGLGVRRDHENGGTPFLSWANQPISGIVGPNRLIEFSLTDGATEGQQILLQNGGVILRGEAGVETAIAASGFIFVGTDNAGADDLWRFYNVTRGRDYINLLMLKTLRFYLGRFNITGQTIEAIVQTIKSALRDLQADGSILGSNVSFTRDQNTPENLRLGRFNMTFAAEEAPVLRFLGLNSTRYRPALDALLDDLLVQLDTAV
jgi:phage tail sheath protein FI